MMKSRTAMAKIKTNTSWNLMTHFTPDIAIASRASNTINPMLRIAHVLFQPTKLENDSAKPVQYMAVATAFGGGREEF